MNVDDLIKSLQGKLQEKELSGAGKEVFDQISQLTNPTTENNQKLDNMIAALHQKGISGTGSVIGQLARMVKVDDRKNLVVEPGDFVKAIGEGKPLAVSAPIAYDLWYLHNHVNLFRWVKPSALKSEVRAYVSERLKFIKDKLSSDGKTIRPMKGLTDPSQLVHIRAWDQWYNEAEYFVQLMAFEVRFHDKPIQWDTNRTYYSKVLKKVNVDGLEMTVSAPVKSKMNLDGFVGYLTFPIGQMGVMEQIAFFQESWSDEPNTNIQYRPDAEEKVFNPVPTELFPPKESFNTHCYGDYLTEGWKKSEMYAAQLEVDCLGIPPRSYSKDVKPKGWMRLWIMRDDVFPVPGEFIGILCKPLPVPVHCWWFQESNPFLYAGNWVETGNLSSGIVTAITLEENRTDDGIGDEYKIRYHGIEITVYASDFYRYTVGERVAVLKLGSTATKATRAFSFVDQKQYGEPEPDSVSADYIIIPMTYYKD